MSEQKKRGGFNQEQSKHIADSIRIVAFAQFGFFGYHALQDWEHHWPYVLLSGVMFAFIEAVAVYFLQEVDHE